MAAAAKIDGRDDSPTISLDPTNDKVIATAQQIVKSLATNRTAAEDMLRILSTFDHRFSSINVFSSSSSSSAAPIHDGVIVDCDVVEDGDATDSKGGVGVEGDWYDEERIEVEAKLDEADKIVSRWDSPNSGSLFESSPEDIEEYLSAVDDVIDIAADADFPRDLREKAEILIQIAMSKLEDEFRHNMISNTVLLEADGLQSSIRRLSLSLASDAGETETLYEEFDTSNEAESVDQSSHHHRRQESSSLEERTERLSISEERQNTDLVRPEAIPDLKDIADRMIASNYHKELCQVYSSVRRASLDDCLLVLGLERMSIEEVQRIEWKNLDDKMRKWIQSVKVVIRVLLYGERRLCDQILVESSDQMKEESFVESTKGCVMQLMNFGEAIVLVRRSPEKLFRILDMYEMLLEVMPDLRELYAEELGKYIIEEAKGLLDRLGDAVKGTLMEFASAVQKETSKRPMQGGEIHPLTRYVMNYVKLLVAYSSSLEDLLEDDGADSEDVDCGENNTRLGCRLRLLISYLETNLEDKSKLYEDAAMQFIFLMNNRLYIVQKVKGSDLEKILGENWVRKRRGQIRQYHNSYLRASWTKALSFLKDDGFYGSGSGSANSVSKMALKDRFKNFNLAFEEICKTQTAWKVPDPQLREELRLSTSDTIVPAYRSFLGRFGGHLEFARHAAKYIKYTPEDLESHLQELFEGSAGLSNHPRRKLSS